MGIGDWLRRTFGKDQKTVSLSGHPVYMHKERKDRPLGLSDTPVEWVQQRERHYEQWLGPCASVYHEVVPQVPHIDVYIFPPSPERKRPFYTLITGGMSDHPMHLPDGVDRSLARAEMIMYIPEIEVQPYSTQSCLEVEMLRFMARFPFEYQTWLAVGHTVPNGNPPSPIAPGSLLTTALFLPPLFEPGGFVDGLTLSGEKVNFLWLQPITDAECQLKLARGAEALIDLMEEHQLSPVLHLQRPSML